MEERIAYNELNIGLLNGLYQVEQQVNNSGLDLRLLELIKYRVSLINSCAYCLDMHHQEAIQMGETELRLHALSAWQESPFYTTKEKACLAFAEALTNINQGDVSDDVYEPLLDHFSKKEIAVLTLAIAQINSWNRINRAFHIVPGNYKLGQFA